MDTRQVQFDRTKVNAKGKSVKVGTKDLITILKNAVHPNEESNMQNMTKEDKVKYESFEPSYLTSTHWKELVNRASTSNQNKAD